MGSNLVKELSKSHTIYGLDIIAPEREGVAHTYSWNDLEQVPPVDAIIHLAGKAHDTRNKAEADVYFKINTGLTEKIFDYFLGSTARKFIFFSTVKAAADVAIDGKPVDESVVPAPVGPYGESKIRAEEYIRSRSDLSAKGDKQVYILRPCMIHGPGNKGNLNLLYAFISKGLPYPLGRYYNLRSFTSVDNLKFIISHLVTDDIASGIYHIADDEPLSTRQLIEIIAGTLHRKPHIWNTPKSIIGAIARLGDFLPIPLNTMRLQKLTENYVVNNSKIKRAIGIDRLPVNADKGIATTIEWFSQNTNKQ